MFSKRGERGLLVHCIALLLLLVFFFLLGLLLVLSGTLVGLFHEVSFLLFQKLQSVLKILSENWRRHSHELEVVNHLHLMVQMLVLHLSFLHFLI